MFFTTWLFPAYRHEELVKEKTKENRLREAMLEQQKKAEDEELEARCVGAHCVLWSPCTQHQDPGLQPKMPGT